MRDVQETWVERYLASRKNQNAAESSVGLEIELQFLALQKKKNG
jgi:hypothetical protein